MVLMNCSSALDSFTLLHLLIQCLAVRWQSVLGSIVVSISACHAEDPGSIPGRGGHSFFFLPFLSSCCPSLEKYFILIVLFFLLLVSQAQIEAAPRPMDSVIREAHEFLDSSLFAQASSASPTLESSPLVNGDRSQSGTPPSSNGSQSILTTHVPYCRTASPIHLPRSHSKSKHHGRTPKHVSGW